MTMTVDQSVTLFVPDDGEALSRFGWLSAEDISEALGTGFDNDEEAEPRAFMPPPAIPAWQRIFPGL